MKKIPKLSRWIKFKAKFLGRGILLVAKDDKKFEYRLIKRQYEDLAWGSPNQVYIDDKGNYYTHKNYLEGAIIT